MLEIIDLKVNIKDKEILKGINLKLEKGKVYALMGPNGSGKSTFAEVLMGSPKYKIVSGKILLNGEDITELTPDKRAKLGLFLSFQHPTEIEGITVLNFLRQAYNKLNEKKLTIFDFKKILKEKAKILEIEEKFLERYLNKGFSGGEKKKLEILQLITLDPKLAVLDETDSGLDVDALKIVSLGVKTFLSKEKSVLIITHYKRILEHINPDKIFIMLSGKIVYEGEIELLEEIEEKGYARLKNDKL